MIRLPKDPARDFIVLNLTDPQLSDGEWAEGHPNRTILTRTVTELVQRTSPDLITITGDLAWAGHRVRGRNCGSLSHLPPLCVRKRGSHHGKWELRG